MGSSMISLHEASELPQRNEILYEGSGIYEYGSEPWQGSENKFADEALEIIQQIPDSDFDQIKLHLVYEMEHGAHKGANSTHVAQVKDIALEIAGEMSFTLNEKKLMELAVLLHDYRKDPAKPGFLFGHAFDQAANMGTDLLTLAETYGISRETAQLLSENSTQLQMLLSNIIEKHSAIPFIDDALAKILMDKTPNQQLPGFLRGLYMQQRQVNRMQGYGLPAPEATDYYAHVLRAADTLSNYGLNINAKNLNIPGQETLHTRYAGYVKILGFDRGQTLPEKIDNIKLNLVDAVSRGIFEIHPAIEKYAHFSLANMDLLTQFCNENPKFAEDVSNIYHVLSDQNLPVNVRRLTQKRLDAQLDRMFEYMEQNSEQKKR